MGLFIVSSLATQTNMALWTELFTSLYLKKSETNKHLESTKKKNYLAAFLKITSVTTLSSVLGVNRRGDQRQWDNFFLQAWFSVMNMFSALQSKQSSAAQRDKAVVQQQLLWSICTVSTAKDCCVTILNILVTLHSQLMLISHMKWLWSAQEQKRFVRTWKCSKQIFDMWLTLLNSETTQFLQLN